MVRTALLVVVAVALAYASSLTAPFVTFDDQLYITHNARVQTPGLSGFLNIWSPADAYAGRFVEYFPLRDSIYWLLWQIFGANPVPFRVVSMLAHVAASVLVGALARRVGFSSAVATSAALVFAVHPIHIESVVWISGLKDPLYVAFMLGALLTYARFLDDKRPASYALVLALMIASLLSKSMGFVMPLMLLLLDVHVRPEDRFVSRVARVFLPGLIALAFVVHFMAIGRANDVIIPPWGGSWFYNFIFVLWIHLKYALHAIAPIDFRFYYCFSYEPQVMYARLAGGAIFIVAYVIALGYARRRSPLAFFLLAWFPIALFPVSNIVPFPMLFADRYVYAASMATCIALAVLVDRAPQRLRNAVLVLVIVTLGVATALRGALWHDEPGLWRNVLEDEDCQRHPLPHMKLGDSLVDTSPREALDSYHRALKIGQMDARARCKVHVLATKAALSIDDVALATRHVRAAQNSCAADDRYALAAAAAVDARSGDVDKELAAAERAALSDPSPGAVWNRGIARLRKGLVDDGVRDLVTAVDAEPTAFCPLYRALLSAPAEAKLSDMSLAQLRGAFSARCGEP